MKPSLNKLIPKVHPSGNFWGLLIIAGFLLLTRWLFDEDFFLNSLYIIIIYVVIAFIYTSFAIDRITIERKSRYQRRQVGDPFEENILVTNHSLWPVFWMQIRDCSDLNRNHSNRVIGFLGSRQTRIIRLSNILQKRGNILLSPMEVQTSDPLGCFFTSHSIKTTGSLIILPYRVDLSSKQIKNRQADEGRSARITLQQSSLISGSVRNYLDGDPFNRIHWPTTARRGSLHTKLPEISIQQMVWICMDCQKQIHTSRMVLSEQEHMDILDAAWLNTKYALPPDTVEAAVSITSSIAATCLKKGIAVGLAMNQQPFQIVSPGQGIRQQADILNILTYIKANSRVPMALLLNNLSPQLKPGHICFLVTPDDSRDLINTAYQIKKRGVDLRVIHIDRASYASNYNKLNSSEPWTSIHSMQFRYGDPLTNLAAIL